MNHETFATDMATGIEHFSDALHDELTMEELCEYDTPVDVFDMVQRMGREKFNRAWTDLIESMSTYNTYQAHSADNDVPPGVGR